MDIVISDLHISNPLFNKVLESKTLKLLEHNSVDNIYILGDLFDVWEENYNKTIDKHKDLINVINTSNKIKVLIKGNHDPDINVLKSIFPNIYIADSFETSIFNKSTVMLHGDQFDTTESFGKILFPINWLSERIIGFNAKSWLRTIVYKNMLYRNNISNSSIILDMEKGLVETYSELYYLIISGHSHISKIVRLSNGLYANGGSIIDSQSYLSLDKNTVRIRRLCDDLQ
jgi:UDP-2,3-diacylglucosamine pyrophosphatase LpxH